MATRGRKMHSKVVWPGFSNAPPPRHIAQVGRNDPCPCGSGKKYKSCHQSEGSAWLEKLARKQDKEHRREVRARLKQEGVGWFRRLFLRS